MGKYRRCFVCNNTTKDNVVLHKFPNRNAPYYSGWVELCKRALYYVRDEDDFTSSYICSSHFKESDYRLPKVLKIGAIPSVFHIKKKFPNKRTKTAENIVATSPDLVPTSTNEPSPAESIKTGEEISSAPQDLKRQFFGKFSSAEMSSPKKAKLCLMMAKSTIDKKNQQLRLLRQKNRRLTNKIQSLKNLVNHLKSKTLISEEAEEVILNSIPFPLQNMVLKKLKNNNAKKEKKYSEEMRKFAVSLQFYSSRAYEYVRKTWKNLLPHPSTIRGWYSVVDGRPGFTKEAFAAIKEVSQNSLVFCNIVMDEMKIREQLIFSENRFYGTVDLGTGLIPQNDNGIKASYALVFMAVAINAHWKVPLGYFLSRNLASKERSNLVLKCLDLMHETGAHVNSLTFDGASTNISMCHILGANLDYFSKEFRPWFTSPISKEKIFLFLDACHMIKLVRNCFGDFKILKQGNQSIKWDYLVQLTCIQEKEGLHAANKLTRKHINFNDNRMSVKLAAQTMSSSVAKAMLFCKEIGIKQFEECQATSHFCEIFNDSFDLLNVRNKFAKTKGYSMPLSMENIDLIKVKIKNITTYIENLKDQNGNLLLKSLRKTGFIGLIIDLKNYLDLFKIISSKGLEYLLSFKLSQDPIETFFSAIRSRGGFNNNPNAKQFETAYKRLMVKQEISISNSNCLADSIEILHASSRKKKHQNYSENEIEWQFTDLEQQSIKNMFELSSFVDNVMKYVAGFIVAKIIKKKIITCFICSTHLISSYSESSSVLSVIKNNGPFLFPNDDVIQICSVTEKIIRQNKNILFKNKNIVEYLMNSTLQWITLEKIFATNEMYIHISNQELFQNHKINLIKLISRIYIKLRLHHESEIETGSNSNIRQKYSRMILFKGL